MVSPYVSAVNEPVVASAAELQIDINQASKIFVLSNIAGFVGADTTAVLLAAELDRSEDIKLVIDIGTNGEIVLGSKERMVARSAAAGPAFEGAQISSGMRGALDAAGTAYILKSSMLAVGKIEEECRKKALKTTFPMGPGHSYWRSLEDMKTIFYFLQPGRICLRLTDSNLMLPRKSIAMVVGAGRDLPDFKGKTHCDFCSLQKKCQLSHFGDVC